MWDVLSSAAIRDGPLELEGHGDHRQDAGRKPVPGQNRDLFVPETGTRRAFRDVDLGGRVVSMATPTPHYRAEEPPKMSLLP